MLWNSLLCKITIRFTSKTEWSTSVSNTQMWKQVNLGNKKTQLYWKLKNNNKFFRPKNHAPCEGNEHDVAGCNLTVSIKSTVLLPNIFLVCICPQYYFLISFWLFLVSFLTNINVNVYVSMFLWIIQF